VERMSGRIEPNDVALEREGAKQDDRARNLESDETNHLKNMHLQGIPNLNLPIYHPQSH
jgi:hypothetical protein